MIAFEARDMSCGHCASSITQVKAGDASAKVRIDLAALRVEVETGAANSQQVGDAIRVAGYTPIPVSFSSLA